MIDLLDQFLIILQSENVINEKIIILHREYDVPHHVRVSIDLNICVGLWYTVKSQGIHDPKISRLKQEEVKVPPEPIVLAYDIECTKLPLKFPDPNTDEIMMISYMIDGQVQKNNVLHKVYFELILIL